MNRAVHNEHDRISAVEEYRAVGADADWACLELHVAASSGRASAKTIDEGSPLRTGSLPSCGLLANTELRHEHMQRRARVLPELISSDGELGVIESGSSSR